jgi:Meckel syndrome type 1 protein
MMTPHAPDDERLPGEDELSSLYRKLPSIEPPAALDAAVRRAAAEAVKPTVAARRRARWPVALSSAAALVIAAGLAWRMGQMPSKQDELHEAAAQHQAQTVAAQEQPKADHESTEAPSSPPAQVQARIVAPPEPPKLTPPNARVEKAQERRKQMAAPAPAPAVEEASSNPVPAPMPAPPAPPAPPSPPVEIMTKRDDASMNAAPAPAMADKMAQIDRAFDQTAHQQPQAARALRQAPMPTQAMPAPMAEQASPALASSIDLRFNKADTPEQELQKIRDLFAGNQRDDARKRLADFHRDHPDYVLPADLRDQLLQP